MPARQAPRLRLRVLTALTGETIVYDLIRDKVVLQESEAKGEIIETQDRVGGVPARLESSACRCFYRDFGAEDGNGKMPLLTSRRFYDFRDKGGVDAIVMDLGQRRRALSEAVEISGHFIDQGPVVQVKDPTGKGEGTRSTNPRSTLYRSFDRCLQPALSLGLRDLRGGHQGLPPRDHHWRLDDPRKRELCRT